MALYKLDEENKVIPADDVYEWAAWYEVNRDRLILYSTVIVDYKGVILELDPVEHPNYCGKLLATVETKFDCRAAASATPLVYVTGLKDEEPQYRVSDRNKARLSHDQLVRIMISKYEGHRNRK